ncbi:small multidrug resistance protein [Solidesulfovibrio carbinoliphilus subsp. oakridgensis]|uniref:Guanidinium exporter n=1 Tax=Solidesulfovibrio carbinoliphilus subsp. oakridgensis TaxID=694327 RepID=G7Q8E0_9BACT|nr:multidrug efflux SMR transporter [Solidesulfovibrio carbinoliphilus]EHJ48552.1 small multidrug resistance protein [Solidesulfovibrio carbinoliphilus subsp. oakridgensis]
MAWMYLLLAAVCEISWPVGLKLAQGPGRATFGLVLAGVGMAASGWLLYLAQRQIPMGTAYAVWTGIGAAGTFGLGVAFFGDPASLPRFAGVALIVAGVVTLKLAP